MKNKLIKDIRELNKQLNRTPTSAEFNNKYGTIGAVYYHFKSWNSLLKSANIPIARGISKEETIKRITELAKELDKTPTVEDFTKRYTAAGVEKYFGNYNNLVRAAGLVVNKGYSKKELKEILIKQVLDLGRLPTSTEYAEGIKPRPYIHNYFKSWYDFLKYCNIEKDLKNQFIDKGDYYKVLVYSNERNQKDYILIDKDKKHLLENKFINWNEKAGAYVSDYPNQPIRLAEFLHGKIEDNLVYIFKNQNNRDYRIKNMEIGNIREKMRRNKVRVNSNTGVKGVWWNEHRQRYHVSIGLNKENIYIGVFENIEDAVKARLVAEKKYWGKIYQKEVAKKYNID